MHALRLRRRLVLAGLSLSLLAGVGVSAGCQASYAADIRNSTPQPVYAQIMEQFDNGASPRASVRLGPGDRGGVGPVMCREGRAFLVVDTVPNPTTPVSVGMAVGTTIVEVVQEGKETTGPIQVRVIGGSAPAQTQLPPPPQPGRAG